MLRRVDWIGIKKGDLYIFLNETQNPPWCGGAAKPWNYKWQKFLFTIKHP